MTKTARFPSLDGWRAVSIILVLGAHSRDAVGFPKRLDSAFYWLFDGSLGVRFFFVISGFLITNLLLQEHIQTGSVSLRRFYIRRALRILPVYFVYLLVVFLLQVSTTWHQPLIGWIGNLTFTTNFLPGTWTTGHLWSLAVEEQFYFLWPGIFVLLLLGNNFRRALYVLAIPILFAPFFRVVSNMVGGTGTTRQLPFYEYISGILNNQHFHSHILFSSFSFFNYFDSLALGGGFAFLLAHQGDALKKYFVSHSKKVFGLALAAVLLPYVLFHLHILKWFTGPLGDSVQAGGFGVLLLQSVLFPQWWCYRMLNWQIMCQIGVLSYSIYIWQMIFCSNPKIFSFPDFWFMAFPGWLLAACLVATLSYYGLEKPLMGLRARFRKADTPLN